MCGFTAIFAKNISKVDEAHAASMDKLIQHRGPDGCGYFKNDFAVMHHRRLSILDTSDAGHQPMAFKDKYIIVYNGEIYNFKELKVELEKKGYTFATHCDTEVILAAYDCWGEQCLSRFNGMFAIVLLNKQTKKIFFARDRVGIKPLYYCFKEGCLYLFSELKQMLMTKPVDLQINMDAIKEYLSFQYTLTDETFVKEVFMLRAGYYATFNIMSLELSFFQYWDPNTFEIDYKASQDRAENEIRNKLNDSVKLRLRSDVPLGAYLSGGVDSTIISTTAAEHLKSLNTFTFTNPGDSKNDESKVAKETAALIKSNHHEVSLAEIDNILNLWRETIYSLDQPVLGPAILAQQTISKAVAEKVTVILGGQGGDEVFCGYFWYTCMLIQSFFRRLKGFPFRKKWRVLVNILFYSNPRHKRLALVNFLFIFSSPKKHFFRIWVRNTCFNLLTDKGNISKKFLRHFDKNSNIIDNIRRFDFKYWLQGLLQLEDRSSMAASIESRVPILDHELLESILKISPAYSIDGIVNKSVFKSAFRQKINKTVLENKLKKGYTVSLDSWLKDQSVKSYLNELNENKEAFIYQFISQKTNLNTLKPRQKWMLISLQLWYKVYFC